MSETARMDYPHASAAAFESSVRSAGFGVAFLVLLFVSACGGTDSMAGSGLGTAGTAMGEAGVGGGVAGTTAGPPASFESVHAIVSARCASACHDSRMRQGKLSLQSLPGDLCGAYRMWMASTSESGMPGCVGWSLVAPGNPGMSLLIDKLQAQPSSCGARMPFGAPDGLPSADVQTLTTWVQNGAMGPPGCM